MSASIRGRVFQFERTIVLQTAVSTEGTYISTDAMRWETPSDGVLKG